MSNEIRLDGGVVVGVDRCPHCGVATPLLTKVNNTIVVDRGDNFSMIYVTAACSRCKQVTLFAAYALTKDWARGNPDPSEASILKMYPDVPKVPEGLPTSAQRFLQQAIESKHAPDGAVMLAASAIDAMLKAKGYTSGSLYSRIETASEQNILTPDMRDWAHEIRLFANEPRHADDQFQGYQSKDVDQILEFSNALAEYLFVLPARVSKWKAQASR